MYTKEHPHFCLQSIAIEFQTCHAASVAYQNTRHCVLNYIPNLKVETTPTQIAKVMWCMCDAYNAGCIPGSCDNFTIIKL